MKQLKKGMMLNQFSEIDTPTEAYVWASNAVNVSREGGSTELQLEPYWIDISTANDNIMGVIQGDNCAFVFAAQNTITQYNSSGEAVLLVSDANLEIDYPIKGVFRMINNRRYLYWGDGIQNDKYICLDDLDKFKTGGVIDKTKITLLPTYTHPTVTIKSVFDTSSNLKVGMYSLVTRYLDYNMNGTDWSIPTVPIPVFKNAVNGSYDAISGGSTGDTSGKSLVYTIADYDTRFPYIEFAIIRYTENGQEIYKLDSIDNIHSTYTVNFIDYSTSPQLSLDEITIPSSKYITSSNMVMYDNRLIRSNLKEAAVEYAALQQFANTIRVGYVVKEIPYGIQDSGEELNTNGSAKSGKYYENKSFLRGEVYALGLVPYYKNGQRLPVFHIPGRELDKDIYGNIIDIPTYNTLVLHSRPDATTAWDSEIVPLDNNTKHFEALGITEPQRWQVYNTAIKTSSAGTSNYGSMSYFECRDLSNNAVDYRVVSADCDYYPTGAIRHHKMPDCTLEPHYRYDAGEDQYYIRTLGINIPDEYLTLALLQEIDPNIVGYDIVVADRTYNKTIEDKGILTGNFAKKYYNGDDKTTAANLNKIYHQSMMMSYDNNVPKSFTNQIDQEHDLGHFTTLPACSENIGYSSKNNNLDNGDYKTAQFLTNLVGFHSPKSKINAKAYSGSFMKFELEMFTNLEGGEDGYYTVNNPNFFIHNNRYKWKSRETKHILVTSAYQRLYGTNRPYAGKDTTVSVACGDEPLYNRNITTGVYYDADSSYGEQISLTYPQPFINKTQQEVVLYEITNAADSISAANEVRDEDSDSAINDAWASNNPRWIDMLYSGEQYNVVKPTQFMRDGTLGLSSSGYDCTGFYDRIVNYGGIMGYSYVAITNYIPDVYSNLQGLTYYKNYQVAQRDNNDKGNNYFAGDVFISRFAFKRSFYGYVPNSSYYASWSKSQLQADLVGTAEVDWYNTDVNDVSDDKTNSFYEAVVIDTFYESDINPEFREEGDTSWDNKNFKFNGEDMDQDPVYNQNSDTRVQLYYPKYYGLYARAWCHLELNANSISRLTNDGEWDYYQLFPNYYKLNPVFNQLNKMVQFKPLSLQYDYCNVQTDYPNRVVWSDKAFGSDIRDTFRKFKVLNQLDINSVDSKINNMYDYDNTLWLLTNNNAYYVPLNSQQLQVQDQTAYLGNPSFMSVGPFRVKNSINFGGARSRFAGIHTPYGYFYVSENDYEIYHNDGKLQNITDNISQWWRYNMGLDIVEKFKALNLECPYEDKRGNYAEQFAGYTLGYDPNHERLLVTKVDFIFPTLGLSTDPSPVEGNYYYNVSTGAVSRYDGASMIPVDIADFQKSYTLSYDLRQKQWVSFHQQHSEFTFFTSEYNAYCLIRNQGMKLQLSDHEGSSERTLIVEFVNYNVPSNATLESFSFGLRSSLWDSTKQRYYDSNDFSAYFMSYNSYQHSKLHTLTLANGGTPFSHDAKPMYLRNGLYNVAGIKDYSTSSNFMSQVYVEAYDGYPAPWDLTSYSFTNPAMYNLRQLRDKYAITRLYIHPNNANQNVRVQLTNSNYKQTR